MATLLTLLAAVIIFVATYVLNSFRRLGRFPIDRPSVALLVPA